MILAAFLLVGFAASAQFNAGVGLAYGTDMLNSDGEEGAMGINLRAGFGISEKLNINAGATYYLDGVDDFSAFSIDVDAHYIFAITENFKAYPLAGISLGVVTLSFGGESETEADFGVNLGAGASYNFTDNLKAFLEAKYTIEAFDQFVPTLGVNYSF